MLTLIVYSFILIASEGFLPATLTCLEITEQASQFYC
uniref:Uncharacterized protein n=1 Tax=Rhizophora mucronata TaxID=61149 RepID=A0A2P2IYG6_RHIMU